VSGVDTAALEAALKAWEADEIGVLDIEEVLLPALPALLTIATAAERLMTEAYVAPSTAWDAATLPLMVKVETYTALRAALDGVTDEAKP
jgi:hypothetical protein